jgi:hypothetical protein
MGGEVLRPTAKQKQAVGGRGQHDETAKGWTMHPLNWKVMMWSFGLFAAAIFVSCVVYGLLVPKAFHAAQLLEMVFPGFRWLTVGSFILGLVESFLYGTYAGLVFVPIYNLVLRRWQ